MCRVCVVVYICGCPVLNVSLYHVMETRLLLSITRLMLRKLGKKPGDTKAASSLCARGITALRCSWILFLRGHSVPLLSPK